MDEAWPICGPKRGFRGVQRCRLPTRFRGLNILGQVDGKVSFLHGICQIL